MKKIKLLFLMLSAFMLFACLCSCQADDGKYNDGDEGASTTTYTVTFDSQCDKVIPEQTVRENHRITKPKDPTITTPNNYKVEFLGWFYQGAGGETEWDFNKDRVTHDITLTAKWEKYIFTVRYDAEGSNVNSEPFTVYKGDRLTRPRNPQKEDAFNVYKFVEWVYYKDGVETVWDFSTRIEEDVTIVAKWEIASTDTPEYLPD